ncbi:hypothetical protein ACEN2J_01950 [Pseudorhodobacter sp. W20_MBD10_FR17]|uniref:hypothetical protein n=1 Tax=Pseudorhodobacter sp. W20_MBD10_FR17 TaxID=3240266 RepID=UPI003F9A2C79
MWFPTSSVGTHVPTGRREKQAFSPFSGICVEKISRDTKKYLALGYADNLYVGIKVSINLAFLPLNNENIRLKS